MTSMRMALMLAATVLLSALGGCVTLSMNPLYETDDLVAEPVLEGLWGDADDQGADTWQFTFREDGSYELIIRSENTLRVDPALDGVFIAHLLTVDGELFLDLFPDEPQNSNEFFMSHVVPAHSFWHARIEGNVLLLAAMDASKLDRAIDEGRIVIEHVKRDNMGVLTASTPDLQRLVSEHVDEFFDDLDTFTRLR